MGCTDECYITLPVTGVKMWKRDALCLREHTCPMCGGAGELVQTADDVLEERMNQAFDEW